jgi:hypothetical protein
MDGGIFVNRKRFLSTLVVVMLLAAMPFRVAAADTNDNFADASSVSVPFSVTASTTTATTQSGEPVPPCSFQIFRTLWYRFTAPSSEWIRTSVTGDFAAEVALYSAAGTSFPDLTLVNCNAYNSPVGFTTQVTEGQTYYFQLGETTDSGSTLTLDVAAVPPPSNDDLSNAAVIPGLPFDAQADLTAATLQPGEPTDCLLGDRTVWYDYTPAQSGFVTGTAQAPTGAWLSAYTGPSVESLADVACFDGQGTLTFHVDAGTTYHIRASVSPYYPGVFNLSFHLNVAPDVTVVFGLNPSDPTRFDTVSFYGQVYDPAYMQAASWQWTFGDGANADVQYPTHRYVADGDYLVEVTATMTDGRMSSGSATIHVRTHDIAITTFRVPTTARPDQIKTIQVSVNNRLYPETVQVDLYISTVSGYRLVATKTQAVPAVKGASTTNYSFTYRFTNDDASFGNVTFQAVASITGARDARPADNTAISSIVIVR